MDGQYWKQFNQHMTEELEAGSEEGICWSKQPSFCISWNRTLRSQPQFFLGWCKASLPDLFRPKPWIGHHSGAVRSSALIPGSPWQWKLDWISCIWGSCPQELDNSSSLLTGYSTCPFKAWSGAGALCLLLGQEVGIKPFPFPNL